MMIPILVGSQTGNGFHLARLLSSMIPSSFLLNVDEFGILTINNFPFIVFIISTHGDGQCPYTAAKLYNMVTMQCAIKDHKQLFSFDFALLGLGDSSYQKYNYCARIFSEKLEVLGARCVLKEFADAQEENGMYDGFWRFANGLIEFDYAKDTSNISESYLSENHIHKQIYTENNQNPSEISANTSVYYEASVVSNDRVTPRDYEHPVYEIILDVPGYDGATFLPGDTISILPENVADPIQYFDLSVEQAEVLRKSVDFSAPIHQTFFTDLATFTNSTLHKDKLMEISKDYSLYYDYVVVPRRNIIEIAKDFGLKLSFDFLKGLNPIYPRYFSFSVIRDKNGHPRLHVLYNIVQYKTYLEKERLGICSQYLSTLKERDAIRIGVCKGRLFLEGDKLLFFATGTGITLPRSAIHHFRKTKEIKVFYGFRFHDKDQLCKNEMCNVDITYAASRDENKYITDAYRDSPVENIEEWLIFVSGNCRLNKSIRELLKEVHGKDIPFQSETW